MRALRAKSARRPWGQGGSWLSLCLSCSDGILQATMKPAQTAGHPSNGHMPLQPPLGPRSPDLRRLLLGLFLRRPELVSGLRLLHRDRLGGVDQQVHRLAHRDVLAQRLVAALLDGALE